MKILAPFTPWIGGGGVITVVADYPDQAFYWELKAIDPATGEEVAPLGNLKWAITKAGPAGLSVNCYFAPTDPGLAGRTERVRVRAS